MVKHSTLQWVAALFSIIFSIAALPVTAASPVPSNIDNGLRTIYQDFLQSQSITVPQHVSDGPNPLTEVANAYRVNAVQDDQGRFNVMLHLSGTRTLDQVAQDLTAGGRFKITSKSSRYRNGVIEGWLKIDDVAAIARTKGVRTVALSIAPVFNVGAVTQQGVVQHRVDQIAQDGTGISIGAMSDSFNISTVASNGPITIHYAQDIASGDLPGPGNPLGNTTPVSVLDDTSSPSTSNDEGRAMLQLIHDMAPKARLAFATAGASKQQFADNIRSLAALPGAPRISPDGFKADIIVDDVIFLDEPMFSDGIVAQAVNDVNAAGVHYFSSAGNQPSTQGYASDFRFVDPNNNPAQGTNLQLASVASICTGGYHNFRTDGTVDIAQTLVRTGATTAASTSTQLILQWDDPFDKQVVGTLTSHQTGTYAGTPQDFFVPATAGTPTRLAVFADVGSSYDAIVTLTDPNGTVVVNAQDTDVDETIFFTPTVTGNYARRVRRHDRRLHHRDVRQQHARHHDGLQHPVLRHLHRRVARRRRDGQRRLQRAVRIREHGLVRSREELRADGDLPFGNAESAGQSPPLCVLQHERHTGRVRRLPISDDLRPQHRA